MKQSDIFQTLFKNSNYDLSLFSAKEIQALREKVFTKTIKDKETAFIRCLILKDKIANERKSLKDIILEMEDEVLANAGVDVFEEVFKLIFTKLYDEYRSQRDKGIINYFLRQVTKNRCPGAGNFLSGGGARLSGWTGL